jgi:tetrapyrrole methylase family protein/MazG family protein
MDKFEVKDRYGLEDLVALVKALRDPENGCPWDREQTHSSIRQNFIEETYEAVEAIDRADSALLAEELGDVLLQVMLHAEIERQSGGFDIGDVADGICKKLVLRHPHIFGGLKVKGSGEVLQNWEDIKRREKSQKTGSDAISDVPRALPALMRCQKVQKRAAYAGFGRGGIAEAVSCLESELAGLKEAAAGNGEVAEKLGVVIFAAADVARLAGADAELCAGRSCDRFARRFRILEDLAGRRGLELGEAGSRLLDELWREAEGGRRR